MTWRDGAGARFARLGRSGLGRIAPRRLPSVARTMRRAVMSVLHEAPGAFPTNRPRDGTAAMLRGGWHHAARRSTERMRRAWHARHHSSPRASLRGMALAGQRVAHGLGPEIRPVGARLSTHRVSAGSSGRRLMHVLGPEIRPAGVQLSAHRVPAGWSRRPVAHGVPLVRKPLRAGNPGIAAAAGRKVAPQMVLGRSGLRASHGARGSAASSARPVAPVVSGRAIRSEAAGLAAATAPARPAARFAAPERMDLGRWLGGLFGDEARRPPSGVTGFDARLSPVFPGRKPGF
ncbi:hypothetical protein [Acidiphilium sp. C61]|jgi:hypothetical protein|uniref:hypothetical protein n=1 Tax=Acidiphilium sp. C61 TaxID=1671485 RepID=UPI00157BA21D|nr:hypothetical protein [Acidiphilium sp. C61]